MRMDSRLSLIASLIRHGSRIADIGTDHAKLPIWLITQSICPYAIATDIRESPLKRASSAIEKAGVQAHISVRLGDGLSPVSPDEVDDIAIAGMGGETISLILDAAAWTRDAKYNFILQPMSKPERLHKYLLTNGFWIYDERICSRGKRLYPVLAVRFDPEKAAAQAKHPAAFIRGALLADRDYIYLKKQHDRFVKAAEELSRAGRRQDAEILKRQTDALFR